MAWVTGLLVILASTGGAGFVWMFERHVPSFRQHLPDRVTKLIYSSLIFAVVFGCPIYYASTYVYTYYIKLDKRPPGWVWVGLIVVVVLPPVLGEIIGYYWEKICAIWGSIKVFIRRRLFRHEPNDEFKYEPKDEKWRPDIPTAFDYVIRLLIKKRSLRPIVVIHYTNTGNRRYVAIGHLGHASGTPNPQDIYLSKVYYCGPEKHIKPGVVLRKQEIGCLINYKDVVYTRVKFLKDEVNKEDMKKDMIRPSDSITIGNPTLQIKE